MQLIFIGPHVKFQCQISVPILSAILTDISTIPNINTFLLSSTLLLSSHCCY
ncbi:hypothetical protein HanIR_Chr02g0094671 [Helianthus annuus]|nr:hypothetical protein HanIR_Chr02g0094671 [Helianthus annuus]